MAKTIADYMVLSDGPFEIDSIPDGTVPVAKNLEFDLPRDFVIGTNRARPILQFLYGAKSGDGRFGLWINVQNSAFVEGTLNASFFWPERVGPEIATWECFQGNLFRAGETNRIRFGFPAGWNGTLVVRDVVLWFQRNV